MAIRAETSAAAARVAVLDVIRGAAILAILFVNIGEMGASEVMRAGLAWTPADAGVFVFLRLFVFGTARGLLQLLFGAGIVILAGRRSTWLFYRRSLLLIGFGLINVFALLWNGDILVIYGLAALLVFPLHRLRARWLLVPAALYAGWSSWHSLDFYRAEHARATALIGAEQRRDAGLAPTTADEVALKAAAARQPDAPIDPAYVKIRAQEQDARRTVVGYIEQQWQHWLDVARSWFALVVMVEAAATICLGMALWKLGVLQGRRSRRFYLVLMLAGYAAGIAARGAGLPALFAYRPDASPTPLLDEWGRLAITLGHVGAVNLVVAAGVSLRPLQAAGRGAFSIYLLQSAICLWVLFAPWPWSLWSRLDYPGLCVVAAIVDAALLLAAMWWFRRFTLGPLEWVWRSLAYGARQPWRATRPVLPA